MRRLLPCILFVALALPTGVSAASWHHFANKQFGFALRYPGNWHLTVNRVGSRQVLLSHQGAQIDAMTILVLPIKPARTVPGTMQRFGKYLRSVGNSGLSHGRWSSVAVGGRRGMVSIVRPSTEGGVGQSEAIYVVPSRSRVYEITLVAYANKAPSQLSQFPGVYRQILATWRFL